MAPFKLFRKAPSPTSTSVPVNSTSRQQHPFSEAAIQTKAHQVYERRLAQGLAGTAEGDWQQAIRALKWARSPLGKTLHVLGTPVRAVKFVQFAFKADSPKEALDVVKTVISALGLIATVSAVIGLVINYQQGQERLVTDRFAKAVEQLGSKEVNVRIGAIYSLERIAKDSPIDHWTVMEVLTAYVKERSRLPKDWAKTPPDKRQDLPKVTNDVQSVLTVIRRRNSKNDPVIPGLSLAGTNLRSAKLWSTNLNNANLEAANLSEANLYETNFIRANLNFANLSFAMLKDADLIGAYLSEANLFAAYLENARLQDAYLRNANLSIATLIGANLIRTDLRGANLKDAYFRNANLYGANLEGANLEGATDWTDEQLSKAYLCRTKLPEDSQLAPNRDCEKLGITPQTPSP